MIGRARVIRIDITIDIFLRYRGQEEIDAFPRGRKDAIDTSRDDERRRGTSSRHVRHRQRTVKGTDRPTKDAFVAFHKTFGRKANQATHPRNMGSVSVARFGYRAVCWTVSIVPAQTFQTPLGGWNEQRTIDTQDTRRKRRSMHPHRWTSLLACTCFRNVRPEDVARVPWWVPRPAWHSRNGDVSSSLVCFHPSLRFGTHPTWIVCIVASCGSIHALTTAAFAPCEWHGLAITTPTPPTVLEGEPPRARSSNRRNAGFGPVEIWP